MLTEIRERERELAKALTLTSFLCSSRKVVVYPVSSTDCIDFFGFLMQSELNNISWFGLRTTYRRIPEQCSGLCRVVAKSESAGVFLILIVIYWLKPNPFRSANYKNKWSVIFKPLPVWAPNQSWLGFKKIVFPLRYLSMWSSIFFPGLSEENLQKLSIIPNHYSNVKP